MIVMISMKDVSKRIRRRSVLLNVNLVIPPAEVVGLWGINGSGKTMLMRVAAGLVHPDSGVVEVNGVRLKKGGRFPSSLGALIETPSFLPHRSGFDNLKLLASIRRQIDDDEISIWLERVGLDPMDCQAFKNYSLGMRQRLGIAAALMEKPAVVLLDEPTNALDAQGVAMVKREIKNCRDRGASVVVACHDRDILECVSNEIVVVENGRTSSPVLSAECC